VEGDRTGGGTRLLQLGLLDQFDDARAVIFYTSRPHALNREQFLITVGTNSGDSRERLIVHHAEGRYPATFCFGLSPALELSEQGR
jgi:hypothetical protein